MDSGFRRNDGERAFAGMRITRDRACTASATRAQASRTPAAAAAGGFAEAVGFGRDLPLALALSQVVPTQRSPMPRMVKLAPVKFVLVKVTFGSVS